MHSDRSGEILRSHPIAPEALRLRDEALHASQHVTQATIIQVAAQVRALRAQVPSAYLAHVLCNRLS